MTDKIFQTVWIFNGNKSRFPSAVFSTKEKAIEWIETSGVEGALTAYPVDVSVYDWSIGTGCFMPKSDTQKTPDFIANFSSASQEHFHFVRHEPEDRQTD